MCGFQVKPYVDMNNFSASLSLYLLYYLLTISLWTISLVRRAWNKFVLFFTYRKSRNLSEKRRRDQFNLLVNELSSMVSSTNRKMDKSTVLKSTINFLKHQNGRRIKRLFYKIWSMCSFLSVEISTRSRVHEIQEDWKPAFLPNEEFTHLVLEAIDGYILVFSTNGRIVYASESITSLLGYLPVWKPRATLKSLITRT